MSPRDPEPDILKHVRETLERSGATIGEGQRREEIREEMREAETPYARMRRLHGQFRKAAAFYDNALSTAQYLWNDWGRPAYKIVEPVAGRIGRGYMWFFNKAAYGLDENGERTVFSKKRAAGAVVSTVLAAAMAWNAGLPLVGQIIYDSGAMITTGVDYPALMQGKMQMKTRVLYLTGRHLIDADSKLYEVTGCNKRECDSSQTEYFRLRENVFMSMYNLAAKGELYFPEYVAAGIPQETALCVINPYGVRVKTMEWYHHITDAQCTSIQSLDSLPQDVTTLKSLADYHQFVTAHQRLAPSAYVQPQGHFVETMAVSVPAP